MKKNIVGREIEIEKLENYITSHKSEFIASFGSGEQVLKS